MKRGRIKSRREYISLLRESNLPPKIQEKYIETYDADQREKNRLRIERDRAKTEDDLTGLYNRRGFYKELKKEIGKVKRYGENLSLIFADLDGFKEYNDTFGHSAGDYILRRIGKIIRGLKRKDVDIAARYGGEEFTIILPNTTAEESIRLALRLRDKLHEEFPEPKISMSFGIAEITEDSKFGYKKLVNMADSAMYDAKKWGRDQIFIYGKNWLPYFAPEEPISSYTQH